MNPASPHPGCSSGRKRKSPDIGGGDSTIAAALPCGGGGGGEDSDGSWEDADSSDEEKLKIDEPKKKKARTKVKKAATMPTEIPEHILEECRSLGALDRNLDLKAKKNNMTCKQVKLVLKSIFSSPELLSLLHKAGLATIPSSKEASLPTAEPKMTRAMAKTLTEAGDVVPWIVNPATPMKEPAPEMVSLVTEEFPDEEEEALDPEYRPELEPPVSEDEDSLLVSDRSEYGTPRTTATESSVNTPSSALRSTPGTVLGGFKKPLAGGTPRSGQVSRHLHFDNSGWEGYDTRSRRSLNAVNIEELEQMFVPFDITPDMYDIPCDNDDYAEFLKTLYAGGPSGQKTDGPQDSSMNVEDDPADDPEYRFQPDEEDIQLRDPEELRNDKATKISRKEVAELMSELLECATRDMQTENKQKTKKKRNSQPPTPLPVPPPEEGEKAGTSSSDKARVSSRQVVEPTARQAEEEESAAGEWVSSRQREDLAVQVQQHIQLLTQMSLLSSHNPKLATVNGECSTMLSDVFNKSLLNLNSVLSQSNLLPSMALIDKWKKEGANPTLIVSDKKSNHKKRKPVPMLTSKVLDCMVDSDVFYFPRLLPTSGLDSDLTGRLVWTEGEDQLIAQALERLTSRATKHKIHRPDIAFTIHAQHMQAKTPQSIKTRMKNLKASGSPNPVLTVFETGKAPPVARLGERPAAGGLTLRQMVAGGRRDDIPDIYISHILRKIRREQRRRFVPIEPKEEVVVEPDLPPQEAMQQVWIKEEDADEAVAAEDALEAEKPAPLPEPPPPPPEDPPETVLAETSPSRRPLRKLLPAFKRGRLLTFTPLNSCLSPPRLITNGTILCVDGNSTTPGSLSDSDTPAGPSQPTAQRTAFSSPPRALRPPLGSASSSSSALTSPRKSYLGSAAAAVSVTFAKSPLKAASDRILRKYTSPLKKRQSLRESIRRRPVFSPAKAAGAITPRRLIALAPPSSSTKGGVNGTPPCAATATGGTPPARCRGSPALVSPREEDQDTPTAGGRRKTRHQKEAEVTLALLGPLETEEEKEARETRECMEMYGEVQRVVSTSEEMNAKFQEIISAAGIRGVTTTYVELNKLLEGHPNVQDLLLDLLSCEEAASLGTEVYAAHAQRMKMKRFLLKLGVAYKHQPAYHVKVLKELDSLCKESTLTPHTLKAAATRLFKHNQHLLDEFLMLVPGVEPPESMLPSPEDLSYPEDSDASWEGLEEERVSVPSSPLEERGSGPPIRFINGEVFVAEGKILKPARVEKRPL